MKQNKVIGLFLLVLSILTISGMLMNNDDFWAVFNYITLIGCIPGGILLLKQK